MSFEIGQVVVVENAPACLTEYLGGDGGVIEAVSNARSPFFEPVRSDQSNNLDVASHAT